MPDITVLVADDLKFFLEIERTYLKRGGFDVLTADGGQKAVDLAKKHRPHLILLDLEMPQMDGAAACVELRKDPALATTPIIIMSASGTEETRQRCLKAGCTEFVVKPERPDELLGIVARILTVRQRAATRITVVFNVTGEVDGRQVVGQARNLSATGLLLESNSQIPAGATLDLELFLPKNPNALKVKGRVVRARQLAGGSHEAGIRFIDLSQSQQEQILEYVSS
ncbi:MAG: response regulator [Acidobacteriota bacterium]